MGEFIRTRNDWGALGTPDTWPQSLITIIRLMLSSRYAMWFGWGPDLTFFYNDAYREQTLGNKHPWALGRSSREVWAEIWDTVGPRIERVLQTGEATWDEGLLLFLERNGYPEETYHTFSYSPAPGDDGTTAGLFCVVIEETDRVIGERRLKLLKDFATLLGTAKGTAGVLAALEQCLTADRREFAFSLTYLFDDSEDVARRVARTTIADAHPQARDLVRVDDDDSPWAFAKLRDGGAARLVALDPARAWPATPWGKPPSHAVVIPIGGATLERPAGVFVAGLNPYRPVDEGAQSFAHLFVGQLAAALANARAYEEQLRRAESLAELDRAKTRFFSNVSHEFRTPLTLMLAPIDDLRAVRERDPEERARLDLLHRNALRLLKLVNTLLEFSRLEAGRADARYEPTDLAALTSDLASSFRSAVERAGLELRVDCPTLVEPFYVDRSMWEKIVLNLLSNALKFTFEGFISVGLHVLADGSAELLVRDTGTGIAPSELPRLFERFHRIEGVRSRSHEGSGIGLALVEELARMHGGGVRVESTVGVGTSFAVRVPHGSAHLPAARIGPSDSSPANPITPEVYVDEALHWLPTTDSAISIVPQERGGAAGDRPRIVFADDNADMRAYVTRLLRERWDVECVSDGVLALEAVRRTYPDLLLADVMMPGLDGFGLLRAVRSDAALRAIPVVLLSARAGEEATAEALNAGADDYIVKPFSASDLIVRISARLAAARAARDADEQRKNLYRHFMQAPFSVAVFRGPSHVVELANEVTLRSWGKTADVVGVPLAEALPELRGQPFLGILDEVYRTGRSYEGRGERARLPSGRDGSLEDAYFNYVYAPLFDAHGAVEGILLSSFDVTKEVVAAETLKEAAAARALALEAAERTGRAKDEFLATMSHELRTPLNAMLGWARILRGDHRDPAKVEKGLAIIERNAVSQARLVSDLLDVSRIIAGKLRLALQPVDLGAVIGAALDVVRPAADAKNVALVVALDESVGTVVADPDRVQQVVWNLLVNAVRFTPSRGSVTVLGHRSGPNVVIVVKDTGAGIPAEHLPYIFERFRQVDGSTTRAHGGLGLGLAIVRYLVDAHGGTVVATSQGTGTGATFTVTLPVRAVDSADASAENAARANEAERLSLREPERLLEHVRALVVDDDLDSLDLAREILETKGASVVTAAGSREALEAFTKRGPFDVVISDIGMPQMDGYALMALLRAQPSWRATTAIALTAYARAEDADHALRAGFQEHLPKPIDAHALVRAVQHWAHKTKTPD